VWGNQSIPEGRGGYFEATLTNSAISIRNMVCIVAIYVYFVYVQMLNIANMAQISDAYH
jgi:hypothetical protein